MFGLAVTFLTLIAIIMLLPNVVRSFDDEEDDIIDADLSTVSIIVILIMLTFFFDRSLRIRNQYK